MLDHLEILLENVGDAVQEPPSQAIPRQKIPSWMRKSILWTLLPFVLLDLSMQRLARKLVRPPFIQKGSCKKRGNCCHYIMIEKGTGLFGRLYYLWFTEIHGFYPRLPTPQNYEGKKVFVMGCRHLRKDGSCGHYQLRPTVCRKWPLIEHFGHPKILKGCGFKAELRNPPSS